MTPSDPAEFVRHYLAVMEARDLEAARACLAEDFVMNFPAAPGLRTLEALIAWSAPRYRFVNKTYDQIEAYADGALAVVYVRGRLHGEWPDGAAFADIRFIDRFEVKAGRLVRQDVWNDLGEAAAAAAVS